MEYSNIDFDSFFSYENIGMQKIAKDFHSVSHLALGMSHFSQTMGYRLEQPRGQKCRKEDATVQGIVLMKGVKL